METKESQLEYYLAEMRTISRYETKNSAEKFDLDTMFQHFSELDEDQQFHLGELLLSKRGFKAQTKEDYFAEILESKDPNWFPSPLEIEKQTRFPKYKKFTKPKKSAENGNEKIKTIPVLIFVPHPDDVSYFGGGYIQSVKDRIVRTPDGALGKIEFHLIVATDGAAGFAPQYLEHYSYDERKRIRQAEQLREAETLGIQSVTFFNFPDSELDKFSAENVSQLIEEIQDIRPEMMLSFAHDYGRKQLIRKQQKLISNPTSTNLEHIDHLTTGKIVQEAIRRSGMRRYSLPGRAPYRPQQIVNFDYASSVSSNEITSQKIRGKILAEKVQALAKNRSQIQKYDDLSPEFNALRYLLRVNREIDKNDSNLDENFSIQTIMRLETAEKKSAENKS